LYPFIKGKIYNLYGPAETTIWSTIKDLTGDRVINIGQPLVNTRIYILGKNFSLQPIGIPGELYIGGDGLASGYLNNPELTSTKFIKTMIGAKVEFGDTTSIIPKLMPMSSSLKRKKIENKKRAKKTNIPYHSLKAPQPFIYRTGDLARWLSNGEIEFLGRIDFQVKIRGHRIELKEIENQLLKINNIKEAVVIAMDEGRQLCAYIISTRTFTVSQLREYLSRELPEYMIPSYFIHLEQMPLNPNGKIDRKALPGVEVLQLKVGKTTVAPATELETKIANTWRQVLKLDNVSVQDNFFELGGTSMAVINVNQRLREVLQRDIPVVLMYRYMTIRSLARALQGKEIDRAMNRKEDINTGKQRLKQQFNRRKRV
jgi:acyl-CoA synthetase (AMP-forming)/AMP-acid ligase II